MIFLDCFRQTEQGQAHINVKIGCCNKKFSKKLSKHDSIKLIKLFEMSEEKFDKIIKLIDEINKHSESDEL